MPATTSPAPPAPPAPGRGRVTVELAVGLVPLLLVAGATARRLELPRDYLPTAVAAYGLFAVAVQRLLPVQPWPGLGPANRVTVGRAALVLSLAALVPHAQALSSAGLWWTIGMAAAALCLDGVDGLAARRTGTATAFGARFDMELDSFLMLVLAALVWRSGRLDAWILLLGAPRYPLRRGRVDPAVAAGSPAGTAAPQGGVRRPGRRPRRLPRPRRPRRPCRRRRGAHPGSAGRFVRGGQPLALRSPEGGNRVAPRRLRRGPSPRTTGPRLRVTSARRHPRMVSPVSGRRASTPRGHVLRLANGIDATGQPCNLPRVHEAGKGADHGSDSREQLDHASECGPSAPTEQSTCCARVHVRSTPGSRLVEAPPAQGAVVDERPPVDGHAHADVVVERRQP